MAIKAKIRYADGSGVPSSPGDQAKSHNHPASSVQPVEADDLKESTVDQHSQKTVLRENAEGGAAERHPATPAGQHATGSFTGTGGESTRTRKVHGQR
jgi:hypothetical protein